MSLIINKFEFTSDLKSIDVELTSSVGGDFLRKFHVYIDEGFTSGTYVDLSSKIVGDVLTASFNITAEELGVTTDLLYGIYIGYGEALNVDGVYASASNLIQQRLCLLDKVYKLSNGVTDCSSTVGYSKDDVNTIFLLLESLHYALLSKEYTIALDFYSKINILCTSCDSCGSYTTNDGCVYGIGTMSVEGCFIVF